MNTPVNFELAKLLKEKGFDGNYFHYWNMVNHSGEWKVDTRIWEYTDNYIEAPTIADVVMWLYEKHKIWISVGVVPFEKYYMFEYAISKLDGHIHQDGVFDTPTEAYEAAITYVLTKLI